MKTDYEGILLRKVLLPRGQYLAAFLMRENGKILYISIPQKKKNLSFTPLEIGHCYKIELRIKKRRGNYSENEIFQGKEWQIKWAAQNLRKHYRGVTLAQIFCEFMEKISEEANPWEEDIKENNGAYPLLSNALFYLDQELSCIQDFDKLLMDKHFSWFMAKLIYLLGIGPDFKTCGRCFSSFKDISGITLKIEKGVFYCRECSKNFNASLDETIGHYAFYSFVSFNPYKAIQRDEIPRIPLNTGKKLYDYFYYHHGPELKSIDYLSM